MARALQLGLLESENIMSVTIHSNVHVEARAHVSAPIVRDHREPVRTVVVDHRGDRNWNRQPVRTSRPVIVRPIIQPVYQPVYTPAPIYTSWSPAPSYNYQPAIEIMGPTSLASNQLSIAVPSLGTATQLELDAAGGQTYVAQVIAFSANGTSQVLQVNQMLSASNPTIALPLDNCAQVTRIVVDGHSDWNGALSIRAL